MGSNTLDTGENTPLFTPFLQENEFSLPYCQNADADTTSIFHNGSSAASDPMSTYMQLQIAPPCKQMHVTYQHNTNNNPKTCGNLMVDLNQNQNFQNPMIDPNSLNIGRNIPCMYGRDLQYPTLKVKGASRIHEAMNDSVPFNSFRDPGIDNIVPLIRSNIGGGYKMARKGVEADISDISGPQIQNFVVSEGSSTYNTPNSDGPLIKNFVGSGVGRTCITQNSKVIGCPNKVDGSFLSLRNSGNKDVKLKSEHSGQNPGGLLYGDVFPQLNTSRPGQAIENSFDLGYNSIDGLSSFQNKVDGFTSLGHHEGGWTSSYNNFGVRGGINTTTNSNLFHNKQKPQANLQHGFPSSTRDLGSIGDRNARYPNLNAYKGFVGPYSSSSTRLLDSGQIAASGLASESVKLSWTTPPNCDQLQEHLAETVHNLSPESSMAASFIRFKGSSHSGQLFPASKDSAAQDVNGKAQPRRRKHVQPSGLFSVNDTAAPNGDGVFPNRVGAQVSKDTTAQATGNYLFPQRLGVHANDCRAPAAGDDLFQRSTCVKGQAFPTANGSGLSQASNVFGVPLPSLKRKVMQSPPAAPQAQRRKLTLPPSIHPYVPFSQTAPAPFSHMIKLEGLDGLPQPTGQKCMLCKKDLSFTPEVSVHHRTILPAVAVLPCTHTFHDHCLQTITPEDQSNDPPCIPCAIGEI